MPKRKPYVIGDRTATLVLDDTTPFPGVEIDVSLSMSPATFLAVNEWMAQLDDLDDDPDPGELEAVLRSAADLFAPYLNGWNVADRTGPVPATAAGLLSVRNYEFLGTLIGAWIDAVGAPETN